jgi:hypothetical protein
VPHPDGGAASRGRARTAAAGLLVGAAGFAVSGLGLWLDPRQGWFSYLAAYAYGVSLALGALVFVMVAHVTGATWFVVLRRLTEGVAATLPVFAVLFVPLLFGLDRLYPWVPPLEAMGEQARQLIEHKRPYLNVPFFVARAAVYFAVWIALAHFLGRWSLEQDAGGRPEALAARQRALSAGGLPPLALTMTFAAFDWLMSLEPEWYSTAYGVYYFAGGFVGAIALVTVVARLAGRAGPLAGAVGVSHYHALGKLLLTFVAFWAYIAFSQFFVVWIADLPGEVRWYRLRTEGSWAWVALLLVAGQFALPFLLLLSRDLKRQPGLLTAVAAWVLVAHYVDVYWLVMPVLHEQGARPHWLDLATLAAVIGPAAAFGAWRLRGRAPVPRRDPGLAASLEYHTS